ncbi:MAG TPA: hypothetical protein VL547_07020, partial [Dinghuibacter sp.]|nr:hypothetical protein [Dinghuibacter sp.]
MKYLFLLFALLSFCAAFAQGPPPGDRPGPGGTGATGRLYGKIVDSTGHGIAHVSVLVLGPAAKGAADGKGAPGAPAGGKNVLLKGGETQSNGDFSIEDLPL